VGILSLLGLGRKELQGEGHMLIMGTNTNGPKSVTQFDEEGVLELMDKSDEELDQLLFANGRSHRAQKAWRTIANVSEAKRRKKDQ
jgi:hypothetical protein